MRFLLENGSDEQVSFFPKLYWQGVVDSVDHILFIISDPDIHALEGLPAARISMMNSARAPYMAMREKKEQAGKLSWTLCLYGTASAAEEAGLPLDEYWEQIIEACYLREDDPVTKWKNIQAEIETIKHKLDALQIEKLHIKGVDADLEIRLGKNRQWLGGTGATFQASRYLFLPTGAAHKAVSISTNLYIILESESPGCRLF